MSKSYLVTGGTGFLGSALVRRLLQQGNRVRVFDNNLRGDWGRLHDIRSEVEFCEGDIRDREAVSAATRGVDAVWHLAFVNGTEFFYSLPELVLEVGVKGMLNVLDACIKHGVGDLLVASSSEVYQTPVVVPTDETTPLSIPDPLNPRYSYAAGKLISELLAINYGRKQFERVVVFRPHNVYGPDMGWEHVIPQFAGRMKEACRQPGDPVRFPIQGDGSQTRSFVFIEDFIDALMLLAEKGEHLSIYHVGTMEEITVAMLARMVGECFGRKVDVVPGEPAPGGTPRRCPDIRKITALGYRPKWSLRDGLQITVRWYDENQHRAPSDRSGKEDPRWQLTNA